MATIYELTNYQQKIMDDLFWLEGDDDEQAERARENLKEVFEANRNKIEGKLKYLSSILAELKAIEDSRKEALDKARARHATAKRARERLYDFMLESMTNNDIQKVDGIDVTVAIRKGQLSCSILDESAIPDEYKEEEVTVKIMKREAIKHFKETGEIIEGMFFNANPYLVIK